MSKNKFWNKDTEVKTTAPEVKNITETKIEIDVDSPEYAFERGKKVGIEAVFDILCNYKKGMHDDTYAIDTKLVADWLRLKLKQKGYNL